MNLSTKEIENKLDKLPVSNRPLENDALRAIIQELPGVTLRTKVEEWCNKRDKTIPVLAGEIGMATSGLYYMLDGKRPRRKDKIIAIAYVLQLSLESLNELLKLAGLKELYVKNQEDILVRYGFQNGLTLGEIDKLLEQYKCELRFEEFR